MLMDVSESRAFVAGFKDNSLAWLPEISGNRGVVFDTQPTTVLDR